MIVLCLMIFWCSRSLRSLLVVTANDVVTRVNPHQNAIALTIDLVCLFQQESREQVILGVRMVLGLLKLLV